MPGVSLGSAILNGLLALSGGMCFAFFPFSRLSNSGFILGRHLLTCFPPFSPLISLYLSRLIFKVLDTRQM